MYHHNFYIIHGDLLRHDLVLRPIVITWLRHPLLVRNTNTKYFLLTRFEMLRIPPPALSPVQNHFQTNVPLVQQIYYHQNSTMESFFFLLPYFDLRGFSWFSNCPLLILKNDIKTVDMCFKYGYYNN